MNKREFNKQLRAVGARINADPMKPHQNRLAGPYILRLEPPADYLDSAEFNKFLAPEEISTGGFFDTIPECRDAVRVVANAIAPGPMVDQNIILMMHRVQYVITKDLAEVERARVIDQW